MRYLLLLCTVVFSFGAYAQPELDAPQPPLDQTEEPTSPAQPDEPLTADVSGTPEDTAAFPASVKESDQDYLLLPEEPAPLDAETENVLSGEVISTEETFIEPLEFEDTPPLPVDPRVLAASSEAEERRVKTSYKQARLKAEKEPAVITLLERAQSASTFEAERAAYRAYYRELFRLMRKIDSSIAKKCDLMEKTYLTRLAQTRIEPTIPLEPPPKPELLAN